jgi:hypothetical protein
MNFTKTDLSSFDEIADALGGIVELAIAGGEQECINAMASVLLEVVSQIRRDLHARFTKEQSS